MKNRLQKTLFYLGLLLLLPWLGSSVSSGHPANPLQKIESESEWVSILEQDNIKVSAQLVRCGDRNRRVFLMKIENTNPSISCQLQYTTNVNNNPTAVPQEYSLELAPGSMVEGSCSNLKNRMLVAYTVAGIETSMSNLEFRILTIKTSSHEE